MSSLLHLLKAENPNWIKIISRLSAQDVFQDASEIEEDTNLTALHLLMIKRRSPGLTHTTCMLLTAKILDAFPECSFVWESKTGMNPFHYLAIPLDEDPHSIEKDAALMAIFVRSDQSIINEPTETGETPAYLHVHTLAHFACEGAAPDRLVSTSALALLLPRLRRKRLLFTAPVSKLVDALN